MSTCRRWCARAGPPPLGKPPKGSGDVRNDRALRAALPVSQSGLLGCGHYVLPADLCGNDGRIDPPWQRWQHPQQCTDRGCAGAADDVAVLHVRDDGICRQCRGARRRDWLRQYHPLDQGRQDALHVRPVHWRLPRRRGRVSCCPAGNLDWHLHAVGERRVYRAEPVAGLCLRLFCSRIAQYLHHVGDLLRSGELDAIGYLQLSGCHRVHVRLFRAQRHAAQIAGPRLRILFRAVRFGRLQPGHPISEPGPGQHPSARVDGASCKPSPVVGGHLDRNHCRHGLALSFRRSRFIESKR